MGRPQDRVERDLRELQGIEFFRLVQDLRGNKFLPDIVQERGQSDVPDRRFGEIQAGLPRKGPAERVDSPGEDRMSGCVQAGPVMHPGDVEQEFLERPGVRIVKLILHLYAPFPHGIV